MGHPAMKRPVDKTMRPIRAAMIDQSARMMGILLPAFEPFQTLVERLVVDTFGILHYFIVVLLTHDFHNSPDFR